MIDWLVGLMIVCSFYVVVGGCGLRVGVGGVVAVGDVVVEFVVVVVAVVIVGVVVVVVVLVAAGTTGCAGGWYIVPS